MLRPTPRPNGVSKGFTSHRLSVLALGLPLLCCVQAPPGPAEELTYQGQSWTTFRAESFEYKVEDSKLHLTLHEAVRWAGDQQGGLVYRLVSGDFRVTATVRARRRTNPDETVLSIVSLGGLTARDPNGADKGGEENYVHIVAGNTPRGIGVETKTTVNSSTSFEAVPGKADVELRICRVGATFTLHKRDIGTTDWSLAKSYERADLPGELMVGANIYAVLPPDLRVTFEQLRIEPVSSGEDCTR